MKSIKSRTSACRYCRHYQPEGRRGGMCEQLGALVQASWQACSLALPPFAPSWETLEDAWSLPDATPLVITAPPLVADLDNSTLTMFEETSSCSSEQTKATKVLI